MTPTPIFTSIFSSYSLLFTRCELACICTASGASCTTSMLLISPSFTYYYVIACQLPLLFSKLYTRAFLRSCAPPLLGFTRESCLSVSSASAATPRALTRPRQRPISRQTSTVPRYFNTHIPILSADFVISGVHLLV